MSCDEFLVDDLDDLLGGIDARQHVLAERLGLDAGDEVVDDIEVDVGFEEGPADLAQAFVDIVGREPAAAAELLECLAEATGDAFEHAWILSESRRLAPRVAVVTRGASDLPFGTAASTAPLRYCKTSPSPVQPDRKAKQSRRYATRTPLTANMEPGAVMTRFLVALALTLTPTLALFADDWPQWLGPQRDGSWRETGIVETFPKNGPKTGVEDPHRDGVCRPGGRQQQGVPA